ncbi:hypothetical protein HPB48_013195 [Haemaphysalis longicornis]|uniref:Uncharacterized protein n=1 Tax=Haemaphysalis longicornis TaxID=44386 RepID=A0A9J6FEW2_HAELO|nr:hypothetical protein HPB48_013195 [Haemaphysalis longicornis]
MTSPRLSMPRREAPTRAAPQPPRPGTTAAAALATSQESSVAAGAAKYAALSRELFERYEKEKAAYASKLTEQQKQALAELTLDKKLKLTKRRLSDRAVGGSFSSWFLGKPHSKNEPPSPQLYVQQADQDRLRYDREMQAWSQRLEKEGQSDVLNDLRHDIREIRKSKQGTARKSA